MLTSFSVSGFRTGVIVTLFIIISLHLYPHLRNHLSLPSPSSRATHAKHSGVSLVLDEAYSPQQLSFGAEAFSALESARPSCHPIHSARNGEDPTEHPTDDEVRILSRSHSAMRESVRDLALMLPYEQNTTGIVMAAEKSSLSSLLVSLRLLRRTGSRLPVEVFLPSRADYDDIICGEVLPPLQARCRVLSDTKSTGRFGKMSKCGPLQTFSIVFSSFQRVLFLDAYSFPVHDPEPLFDTPPFSTYGLVTWPGFWPYSASARFYNDIAGISFSSSGVQYATQNGMLMLDKETHHETLMMMMYYNFFGPEYYYHILRQGSQAIASEGDTIVPAALVVGAPFYQVKRGVRVLGHGEEGKHERESGVTAIAQADPFADFQTKAPHVVQDLSVGQVPVKQQNVLGQRLSKELRKMPEPFLVNTGMAPLKPAKLLNADGPAVTAEGKYVRMYTVEKDGKSLVEDFGFDLEQRVWESVAEEACRTDSELCNKIGGYFETVFGDFGVR